MWQTYRKRFVYMQVLILSICAAMRFYFRESWTMVAVCFVVMQVFSVFGAWWGFRLQQRIQKSVDELPLNRRR